MIIGTQNFEMMSQTFFILSLSCIYFCYFLLSPADMLAEIQTLSEQGFQLRGEGGSGGHSKKDSNLLLNNWGCPMPCVYFNICIEYPFSNTYFFLFDSLLNVVANYAQIILPSPIRFLPPWQNLNLKSWRTG